MPKNNTLHINFTEKQGKERLKVVFFKICNAQNTI